MPLLRFLLVFVGAFLSPLWAQRPEFQRPGFSSSSPRKASLGDEVAAGRVPPREAIAQLRKLGYAPGKETEDGRRYDGWHVFREACRKATTIEDLEDLRAILATCPPGSPEFSLQFEVWAEAMAWVKLKAAKDAPKAVVLPKTAPLPASKFPLTPELEQARAASASAMAPYERWRAGTPRKFAHPPAVVEAALRQVLTRDPAHPEVLLQSLHPIPTWFSFSEPTERPADLSPVYWGLILWLWEHDRPAEMIGALWDFQEHLHTRTETLRLTDFVVLYLQACRVDWEAVCLGALVEYYNGKPAPEPKRLYRESLSGPWSNLAASGSPAALRQSLALLRTAPVGDESALIYLSFMLGEGVPVIVPLAGSPQQLTARLPRVPPEPRSAELKAEALPLFARYLEPGRPTQVISDALSWISFNRETPEKLEKPLRALLKHPSFPVARSAADRLEDITNESFEWPPAPAPVRFRLSMPGSMAGVEVMAKWNQQPDNSGYIYRAEPDPEGQFIMERSLIVDVQQLRRAHLLVWPARGGFSRGKPEPVAAHAVVKNPGPLFGATVRLDPNNQQEYVVAPELSELQLTFKVPPTVPPTAKVMVSITGDAVPVDGCRLSTRLAGMVSSTMIFSRVQTGVYQVVIDGEGVGRTEQFLTVKPAPTNCELTLHSAHKLRGLLKSPDGREVDLFHLARLFRLDAGQAHEWVSGIHPGKYRLVVRSSADERFLPRRLAWANIDPPLPAYQELVHEFEVREDSPAEIDLGTFVLKAAK